MMRGQNGCTNNSRTDFQTAFPIPNGPRGQLLLKEAAVVKLRNRIAPGESPHKANPSGKLNHAHAPTDCPSFPGCTASADQCSQYSRPEEAEHIKKRHQDETVFAIHSEEEDAQADS